jgi:thiamine-phosphate pyrophosphorylase
MNADPHPSYTPAAARALESAARRSGSEPGEPVRPVDLLLALLEEDEGRAATVLRGAGLDPAAAGARLSDPSGRVALADAAPGMLPVARRLARELTPDAIVNTEHLLLSLLGADEGLARFLEDLGLDRAGLDDALRHAHTAPLPLIDALDLGATTETIDTARLLDAAANRAREALRVIEDYCRFVLDDAFLTRQLKELRHELAAALGPIAPELSLAARETLRDVGTEISTAREQERTSPTQVVQVNCKRLQEALRSLEEFGKLRGPELGQAVERLRYRSYTLERSLVLGADVRRRLADARLYVLLTGASCTSSMERTVEQAAEGGAQVIQLREKGLTDRDLLGRAREVRRWTRRAGVLFVLNDRPDVARLAEADGVHLGQDDLPVKEARRILGPDALVGVSTHTLEQLRQAVLDGASYVGVGPVFPSRTKEFESLAGLEFVRAAVAETSLPAFAIGGITAANVGQVVAAGVRRVAVSAAVAQAEEPRYAAMALRRALDHG